MTLSALRAGKMSAGSPRGNGGLAPAICGLLPQQGRPLKRAPCTTSEQSPLVSVFACGENCVRSLAPPLPTKSCDFAGAPSPCSPNGVPAPDSISGVVSLAPSSWRSWRYPVQTVIQLFRAKKEAGHIHNHTSRTAPAPLVFVLVCVCNRLYLFQSV